MHRLFLLIGVLAAATACGSSPTTPSSTVNTFHAEVTEGAGDAVVSAAVPTPPDLIHGTLDVGGGNLTVTVQSTTGAARHNPTLRSTLNRFRPTVAQVDLPQMFGRVSGI
jgi:hypothetical protein